MDTNSLIRRTIVKGLCASCTLLGAAGSQVAAGARAATALARQPRIKIVAAPSNLGLRPPAEGREPGAWQAPAVLLDAGLAARVGADRVIETTKPAYSFDAEPGTRIRNGHTIRNHALSLAEVVGGVISAGEFPFVLGGDCSILLGCLLAARQAGPLSLLHVDGHSDFFHPGNYDVTSRLGSVAGMDLALATGRGEPLLTEWPGIRGPLVEDSFVVQLGERNASHPAFGFPEIDETRIRRFFIEDMLRIGMEETARRALAPVDGNVRRTWLHVDLDVLDRAALPAVDSPGSPGLDFDQLAELIRCFVVSGRLIGIDVTIYDPELDPDRLYAPRIVDCLAGGLAPLRRQQSPSM